MFASGDDIELTPDGIESLEEPLKDQKKASEDDGESQVKIKLKKTVGLIEGISLIVGIMIGSGIFASPRSVAKRSKSVGMSLAVWTGCGLIAIFGALSYLELGLMFQGSGNLAYCIGNMW